MPAILCLFLFCVGGLRTQEAPSKTQVTIRAILVDKDLAQKPVPHLSITFAPFDGPVGTTFESKTDFSGTTQRELASGKYRLTTSSIDFAGQTYSWEMELTIGGVAQTVELSNDNAKKTEAKAAAPTRKVDELTTLFQKYQNAVVTVWSEFGHGTGFMVDPAGLIVTNQHVVGPSSVISVQFDAKRKVAASVLAFSAEKDVAILWANPTAFAEMIPAPIAKSESGKSSVLEGERVFTIGSPLSQRKILTSGIVSKVEARAIISDININPGNSGGPLFNSVGEVVGITTFGDQERAGPGISGIVRIEEALPILEQAHKKMADTSLPPSRLLPVEPSDSFPLDSLKETISSQKFDRHPYFFSESGFDVALVTPILRYRNEVEVQLAAAKEKSKRTKKNETAVQNSVGPLEDMKGWAEYVGEYKSILLVTARPQLRETFGSALLRGMAASGGGYGGPAHMKFKTDFYRMKLFCGEKEVEPIQPGKAASVINAHNAFVNVTDATYVGIYSYPPDAISPSCGKVKLQLFSEKDPDKANTKELDQKAVDRIWSDFQPYVANHKQ